MMMPTSGLDALLNGASGSCANYRRRLIRGTALGMALSTFETWSGVRLAEMAVSDPWQGE
jgi:hypothetical protein